MKKIIALILTALMLLSLAACGSDPTNPNSSTAANDTSWEDIKAKGKIVVGIDVLFPPMGFTDENGKIVGFDIDMAYAAAEKMGVEVVIKPIDWASKELELMSKNIDLIWNGYTITDVRRQKVLFTKPYLENKQVIVVKEGSDIASKSDLAGKKIGYQSGSTAFDGIEKDELFPEIENNLQGYPDNNNAMLDLKAGNIEAVVVDEVVANYYITNQQDKYIILEEHFGTEEYGVGVRLEDNALLEKLQGALDEMNNDGTSAKISNKWFGRDAVLK